MIMRSILLTLLFTTALHAEVLYQNDFQKTELGPLPDEFMVIDGQFTVKENAGNKFIELPGAPLEAYSFLFGPKENTNVAVQARIFTKAKGRRYSVFDVGLGGLGGYKLRVTPAKKKLELYRGDTLKTSVPLEWTSGKWTFLKLQVQQTDPFKITITGKIWSEGAQEPADPSITFTDTQPLIRERASAGAMPYAGEPVLFDDLIVTRVK